MSKKKITLNRGQAAAMAKLVDFLSADDSHRVFVLRGYAGTGKTTLLKYLLDELDDKLHMRYRLLSPTARAAKIMRDITGREASTIHSMLFSPRGLNKSLDDIQEQQPSEQAAIDRYGQLFLEFSPTYRDEEEEGAIIYIIDEASMISDTEQRVITQARFGSGRLLSELLNYDHKPGSKFIFIGDPCQLPPVINEADAARTDNSGNAIMSFSPALSPGYICREFQTEVTQAELTEVMRQDNESGLLKVSERLRELRYAAPDTPSAYPPGTNCWKKLPMLGYDDIIFHGNHDLMEDLYVKLYRSKGPDNVIFIARGNAKCLKHSLSIRNKLGLHDSGVQKGDLLMVTQNNPNNNLYNGDMVTVTHVAPSFELHAWLRFRTVTVKSLADNTEHKTLLIEDPLFTGMPNLDSKQSTELYTDFIIRMDRVGIKQNSHAFLLKMSTDPWLNALRATYGYCVTCHKAQGGEWPTVFIDMPGDIMLNPLRQNYQWVYTAITRASREIHLATPTRDYLYSY